MDMFTHIREEVGPLNQEIIVTCHFVSHHLTPFIPVLLYKTPLEDRCVRFLHQERQTQHSLRWGVLLFLAKEDHFPWHKAP